MNEGGKGHHTCTCTRRPHLDLALDDWTLNLNRRHTLTHTHTSINPPWYRRYLGTYPCTYRSDFQITQTYTRLQPARQPAHQPAYQAYPGNPAPTHKATTRTRYNNTTRQNVNQGIWQLGSAGHKMPTPGRLRKPRADLWATAREGKKSCCRSS